MLLHSLHSNLVLFKCGNRRDYIKCIFCLYIPIWFYSNRKWSSFQHHRVLYIPIWFYSNASLRDKGPDLKMSFTFQSGSIQIPAKAIKEIKSKTLHSNLVLFKYCRHCLLLSRFAPLHSNLVLFKSPLPQLPRL